MASVGPALPGPVLDWQMPADRHTPFPEFRGAGGMSPKGHSWMKPHLSSLGTRSQTRRAELSGQEAWGSWNTPPLSCDHSLRQPRPACALPPSPHTHTLPCSGAWAHGRSRGPSDFPASEHRQPLVPAPVLSYHLPLLDHRMQLASAAGPSSFSRLPAPMGWRLSCRNPDALPCSNKQRSKPCGAHKARPPHNTLLRSVPGQKPKPKRALLATPEHTCLALTSCRLVRRPSWARPTPL